MNDRSDGYARTFKSIKTYLLKIKRSNSRRLFAQYRLSSFYIVNMVGRRRMSIVMFIVVVAVVLAISFMFIEHCLEESHSYRDKEILILFFNLNPQRENNLFCSTE